MDKRMLLVIALIGGILIVIAAFGELTGGRSLWDGYDVSVLASGILVLLGALLVLGLEMKSVGAMIPVGGFWALVAGIQAYRAVDVLGLSVGYAVWLAIVGGILAILGTLGLKEK